MVWFLLKICSLHEITQKGSVELCITFDGPELTKDLCHLSFGVKITHEMEHLWHANKMVETGIGAICAPAQGIR
jgi:hypothetical protein